MRNLALMCVLSGVILFAAVTLLSAANNTEQQATRVKPPVLTARGEKNQNVSLQSLDIRVEVAGNIASTRYTMVIKNNTTDTLEAIAAFPLPGERGVTITYYALDIDGKMREAVPVDREWGTQVFETIKWRRVDPGLLEWVEGSEFRTRVYPVPPKGTRTVSIVCEEVLALERDSLYYRLPMLCTDSLEKFSLKATVFKSGQKPRVIESEGGVHFDADGENHTASFTRKNYRPSGAFVFALPAAHADIPQAVTQSALGRRYFLASVAPKIPPRKKQWAADLAIIWDVSLSGARRDLQRDMEILDIIFAEKKNADVRLYFLNNKFTKNGNYKIVGGNWDELKNVLETAVFDGGTDFSQINLNNIAGNEVLFFSDGISTLSAAVFFKNAKANRPIHCIVSSTEADYGTLKQIAGKTKGKLVNVNSLSSENLKYELLNETPMFLGVERGKAVREAYPSAAAPVYGDISVAGISDANDAELTLLFGFGNRVEKRIKVRLEAKSAVGRGSIHKIWAQKKISELGLDYKKNRDEIAKIGRQFGIVTQNTSLIVLETIDDYVRYRIEPPATEPELRAEYRSRRGISTTSEAEVPASFIREVSSPDFMRGGALIPNRDSAAVHRDVVRNIPALRYIYIKRAREKTGLEGTVTVEFSIDEFGKVIFAQMAESTIKDSAFENAVVTNIKGWKFDKTDKPGDIMDITYPFVFSGGSEAVPRREKSVLQIRAAIWKRSDKGITLAGAAETAEYLKRWWNVDFSHPKYKDFASRCFSDMVSVNGGSAKNKDYLNKLTGNLPDDYQTYLKLRKGYAGAPAYYLDMADWFYTRGDRETGLRVLTSIADLEFENAPYHRLLGYRLKEYGEYALEKSVFRMVVLWQPMKPRNDRDYAMALADNGEAQAALDSLYALLTKPYPDDIRGHSWGMEEVVVTEINSLIAKNPRLNISKIDKRLLINIPVDIRVVINWNTDEPDEHTDEPHIDDLYFETPNNERCDGYYYCNSETCGLRESAHNRSGPRQLILKNAVKGKYRIYANYCVHRELNAAGPVAVMAEIFTKYADGSEKRRVISMPVSNPPTRWDNASAVVAKFEF